MKNNTRLSFCLFLLFMGIRVCFAADIYSQRTFFTIESNSLTVKDVLNKIENESEYIFFYMDKSIDLNRKVSVNARGQQVEKILEQVFSGTNTKYYISDRQIILSKTKLNTLPADMQQNGKTIT